MTDILQNKLVAETLMEEGGRLLFAKINLRFSEKTSSDVLRQYSIEGKDFFLRDFFEGVLHLSTYQLTLLVFVDVVVQEKTEFEDHNKSKKLCYWENRPISFPLQRTWRKKWQTNSCLDVRNSI